MSMAIRVALPTSAAASPAVMSKPDPAEARSTSSPTAACHRGHRRPPTLPWPPTARTRRLGRCVRRSARAPARTAGSPLTSRMIGDRNEDQRGHQAGTRRRRSRCRTSQRPAPGIRRSAARRGRWPPSRTRSGARTHAAELPAEPGQPEEPRQARQPDQAPGQRSATSWAAEFPPPFATAVTATSRTPASTRSRQQAQPYRRRATRNPWTVTSPARLTEASSTQRQQQRAGREVPRPPRRRRARSHTQDQADGSGSPSARRRSGCGSLLLRRGAAGHLLLQPGEGSRRCRRRAAQSTANPAKSRGPQARAHDHHGHPAQHPGHERRGRGPADRDPLARSPASASRQVTRRDG